MYKLLRKATLFLLLSSFFLVFSFPFQTYAQERLQEIKERPVIVIDPGHGGENQGTLEGKLDEKYMTLTTALAMYEELCLYDNVDVYLTRTKDTDLTLKERAEFAKSVNADFLFSVHYNASVNHDLFGSEIWIPSAAPFNNYGYQFGYEFLTQLQEQGLFIRGIKTKLNDKGLDYYGIIREAAALDVPAVILEHCHVDESRDADYCDSEEDYIQFGKSDATAVAKYFGLKSSVLNVDYSEYPLKQIDNTLPVSKTLEDNTPPDVCIIELVNADYEKGNLCLNVTATDYDTPLIYYDYSIDGGITYSQRTVWPGSNTLENSYEDTFTLNLIIPDGSKPCVIVRAYNLFDLCTESNLYESPQIFMYPKTISDETEIENQEEEISVAEEEIESDSNAEPVISKQTDEHQEPGFLTFLEICLGVVIILFIILLISQTISYLGRKKRRRQRKKDSGENRNHPR